jgi:hypothetical protein
VHLHDVAVWIREFHADDISSIVEMRVLNFIESQHLNGPTLARAQSSSSLVELALSKAG